MEFALLLLIFAAVAFVIIDYIVRAKSKDAFNLKDDNFNEQIDEIVIPRAAEAEHPSFANKNEVQSQSKLFSNPEQIITLHVQAAEGYAFVGSALIQSLLESWLRLGELGIYHRYDKSGKVMFSVANGVDAASLDVNIDSFITPSVTFFMILPGADKPLQSFEFMLQAAGKLAQDLDGEVKDENFSLLSDQTVEHYRTVITEFERTYQES